MLTLMRNNLQSPFMKLLVIVVAIVMGFWGVSTYSSQSLNVIATVGSEEIPVSAYQMAWDAFSAQIRQNGKIKDFDQYATTFNLRRKILDRLINESLLIQMAKKNGLNVTKEEIANFIYNYAMFQTDGRFDLEKYNQLASQASQSKTDYENRLQKELLRNKFFKLISNLHFLSKEATKLNYILQSTNYNVKFFQVKKKAFFDKVKLTDKDINSYYDKHKANFKTEKTYDIAYAILPKEKLASKDKVSEKAVQRFFKNNHKLFPDNVKTYLTYISIPNKDKKLIDSLYKKLQKNPNQIKQLAQQNHLSNVVYKDLGWEDKKMAKNFFPQHIFEDVAIKGITKPFIIKDSTYIVRVVDRKTTVQTLEENKEGIISHIVNLRQNHKLRSKSKQYSTIVTADKVDKLVTSNQLTWKNVTKFGYETKTGDKLDKTALLSAVRGHEKQKAGVTSSVSQLIFYKLVKVNPNQQQTLDEVKGKVINMAQDEAVTNYMNQKLTKWNDSIDSYDAFSNLAKTLKADVQDSKYNYNKVSIKDVFIPNKIMLKLRSAKEKQVVTFQSFGNGYLVYVDKVNKPDENSDKFKNDLAAFDKSMEQKTSLQFLQDLIDMQKKRSTITYNKKVLELLKI